ncbi:MAG: FHA domain-containing protein, partial [Caldilineaceae bacterium]|nr:FHA domain-containing protein [Caldilineaceae bacterium]
MTPVPTPQPAHLLALHADVQPAQSVLEADVYTLGRSPLCQIVVQRATVSRLHAKIEREGLRYLLVDAGSANGTFVNSQRLHAPHLLSDRDLIGLGAATALLHFVDPDPTVIPALRLHYDERKMLFSLDNQPLDLTPAQFRLLHHLYQFAGEVCTRESCAEAIWGRDYDPGMDADALDRAFSSLRSQLRRVEPEADLIETRRGLGYVL